MPKVELTDLPDAIYQKLQEDADREHRTIAQQAIITLTRGLEISANRLKKRRELITLIKNEAQQFNQYDLSDPVKLIREDRDR